MTDATSGGGRPALSEQDIANHVPQARRGREARVGIFVVAGILSFVVVLFQLTDPATLRGRDVLHTLLDDAGGVRRGDPIQMRGVIVGRVHQFELRTDGLVRVGLEIERGWQVPQGSEVHLGAAGLMGGRTVEIHATNATTFHANGDTLPGHGGRAGGLLGSADQLTGQVETVLTRIETLLDDQTVGSVQGSARELEGLLSELSGVIGEQRGTLADLTESLRSSAEGLESAAAAGPDVASAIARADSVMAILTDTGESLDASIASLRSILDKIDSGEGTFGKLVHDGTLYDNMNASAEQLTSLLEDLQANPKKYINISIF